MRGDALADRVGRFYERHPYPPAVDDLEGYRERWDEGRRRAEFHLLWPQERYRDDFSILAAGCGTRQAAKYALRWPNAKVVGIDVSAASLGFADTLRRKYGLGNLELRQLPIEQAAQLGERFDHVVCTGVLHHLPDPDAGLRALREALAPAGVLHGMVYAPYGRAGVYLIQDYCRRLGVNASDEGIAELVTTLRTLAPDHPLAALLRNSPDFRSKAGLADALLHPRDRAYSVPQLLDFLRGAGLTLARWLRQAPYLPQCGAVASTPHGPRLARLATDEQYAALELLRGTMARHSFVACPQGQARRAAIAFEGQAWGAYAPIRMPDTVTVRDRLPPGASAVLINRGHAYTDIYLPIDPPRERLLEAVDGKRSIAQIARRGGDRALARELFQTLWRHDQVVFDASGSRD